MSLLRFLDHVCRVRRALYDADNPFLRYIRKPVHGLIFLYQYVEEEQDTTVDQADDVWFANQVCAMAFIQLSSYCIESYRD